MCTLVILWRSSGIADLRVHESSPSTGNDFLCSENMGGFWLKITTASYEVSLCSLKIPHCKFYGFEYAWSVFFEWLISSDETSTKWLIVFSSFQTSPRHVKPVNNVTSSQTSQVYEQDENRLHWNIMEIDFQQQQAVQTKCRLSK